MKITELNSYEMALLVFFLQIIFIWLRTINLKHITDGKVVYAILSSNGVAITWMVSTAIGVNSMLNGEIIPIVAHLLGGTVGLYLGMRK